jgi:hypothetical protein
LIFKLWRYGMVGTPFARRRAAPTMSSRFNNHGARGDGGGARGSGGGGVAGGGHGGGGVRFDTSGGRSSGQHYQ